MNGLEQDIVDAVSRERLIETTRTVSAGVRLSGSPAERQAAQYLERELAAAGLETELLEHDAYISLPGSAYIEVAGERLDCITHSFSAHTDGLDVDLLDCTGGNESRLAGARGHAALVDGLAMAERAYRLEATGAAAQIHVNGTITHEMILSTVWGSPTPETVQHLPRTPVVSVTTETARRLRDLAAASGGTIRIVTHVDTGWRTTPLLIARLPGACEDFVLFSGHLDSWHYGAMDNGGANATMVEIARLLARRRDRLQRGLVLAFWSGHSHGRYSGSAWFADHRWRELREHCVAHVNVDSVGGRGATVLSEGVSTASLRAVGAAAIDAVALTAYRGARVGRSGDQSFLGLGIPSLWMSLSEQPPSEDPTAKAFKGIVADSRSGGLGWWWHTTEDTLDKIDPELLLRDARIYALALARLTTASILPTSALAEASEVAAIVERYASASPDGFDLRPALDAAHHLVVACRALDERRDELTRGDSSDADAAAYHATLRVVLRHIVSINYASHPFRPDRAMRLPPVPLLAVLDDARGIEPDSDAARFLAVEFVRRRNQLVASLEEATTAAARGAVARSAVR